MSSREFSEWCAFLQLEPDIGTRADYLATALAQHIARVEATMGGKPPPIKGRLIEWDAHVEDDAEGLAAMLSNMGK
jgi:hypothetical protein